MMRAVDHPTLTLGFLSTLSVYEGTTIDNYTRTLLQGICAAARRGKLRFRQTDRAFKDRRIVYVLGAHAPAHLRIAQIAIGFDER
jgi:hypothetical protein